MKNSLMINSPERMFVSQENPVIKKNFDTTRVNETANRILESQEEVPVRESLSAMPDSPNKKINPIGAESTSKSGFAINPEGEEEQVVQDTEENNLHPEEAPVANVGQREGQEAESA